MLKIRTNTQGRPGTRMVERRTGYMARKNYTEKRLDARDERKRERANRADRALAKMVADFLADNPDAMSWQEAADYQRGENIAEANHF
jgi:hypothetical protein